MPTQPLTRSIAKPPSSPCFFVVDDNRVDSEITCLALKEAFPMSEVKYFDGGAELLSYLETSEAVQAFAMLCDLNMPEMCGRELLEKLTMRKLNTTPFYIYSGGVTPKLKAELMTLGATDVFEKPMDFFETIALLKATLGPLFHVK